MKPFFSSNLFVSNKTIDHIYIHIYHDHIYIFIEYDDEEMIWYQSIHSITL